MSNEQPKNQCQGCMAGWEVKEVPSFLDKKVMNVYHIVEGGYKGEIVSCTKHLYEEE